MSLRIKPVLILALLLFYGAALAEGPVEIKAENKLPSADKSVSPEELPYKPTDFFGEEAGNTHSTQGDGTVVVMPMPPPSEPPVEDAVSEIPIDWVKIPFIPFKTPDLKPAGDPQF